MEQLFKYIVLVYTALVLYIQFMNFIKSKDSLAYERFSSVAIMKLLNVSLVYFLLSVGIIQKKFKLS